MFAIYFTLALVTLFVRFIARLIAAIGFGIAIGLLALAWALMPSKRGALEQIIARAFGVQPEPQRKTRESKAVRLSRRERIAEIERNRIASASRRIQHYETVQQYVDLLQQERNLLQ